MKQTLKDFCDSVEREPWQGLRSAFRNGCRCRVLNTDSNYLFREDFQAAWLRGYEAMDTYLTDGGQITSLKCPECKDLRQIEDYTRPDDTMYDRCFRCRSKSIDEKERATRTDDFLRKIRKQ